jgi:transglutaminase-like putative cysteine protease
MRYAIVHHTQYAYAAPVALSQQLLRLTPRSLPWQQCLAHRIEIAPVPGERAEREDYFGNHVTQLAIAAPHQALAVHAHSEVEVHTRTPVGVEGDAQAWESVRDRLRVIGPDLWLDPAQFLYESPQVRCFAELAEFAAPSFGAGRDLRAAAQDLMHHIHASLEFDPTATNVSTELHEVLSLRRGVCQDFAHLMIGCLRTLGLAARYVSGYILTTPPPGRPRLVGADASHAWVSVHCGDAGWLDLDPTNDCEVDDEHITLAWGRDFSDISPMRGVTLGGGEQMLTVHVTVEPLDDKPG